MEEGRMAVTRERLNQGMTYDQFKAITSNLKAFEASEANIQLADADLTPFRSLPHNLDVLVVITETCPDVVMNLPILDRIARESGKLNVRIFLRDDNKDLMAQYMNGPYESVPVFAFFDPSWNQLGVFIERPKAVTELRQRKTEEIYASNPAFGSPDAPPSELSDEVRAQLQQAIRQMRTDTGKDYARETVRELGDMAAAMARGGAGWRGNLAAVAA
jgi:hypothetical protein